jgi:hypothetical protein
MIPYIEYWKSNLTSFSGTGDVNFSFWLRAVVPGRCRPREKYPQQPTSAFFQTDDGDASIGR